MTGAERTYDAEPPFDLVRTVRGLVTWGNTTWSRTSGDIAVWAERTPAGPATVQLEQRGSRLHTTAWGPGAEALLDRVPALLGLDRAAPAPIGGHPLLERISPRFAGVRGGRVAAIFPSLVSVILAQKVTGKESAQAMWRLVRAWGEPAPGPHERLWLAPEPVAIARRGYAELHPLGVERRRAEVVLEVARRAKRLERAVELPYEEADALLRLIRGIGPWTTGVVLGDALGHEDAVPVGDYHLPNAVAFNLAGEPRADDARMLELLEPWRGRRGRVVRLIGLGGEDPPRWGPRSEARDIRDL
ncbi:MAG: DNA-3-methyladenine glycosylase 2 family protein [Alphaproteobacteria bacterium]|nr:DNA-3-methyladenine glycosylase 2 family protein [Alphaproteobacteria bacterium]MCB9697275.1 DNA-3-methyladenine glycosylase 2 family protein [Alphaproteobacteria bacterium]